MKNIQLKKIIREIILEERSLSFDDFKKIVNGLRKKNKNKWYQWIGTVENKKVRLKGYNTWLQIYDVSGVDYANPMDRSIKDFVSDLQEPF